MITVELLQLAYDQYQQQLKALGKLKAWSGEQAEANILTMLRQRDRIQQLIDLRVKQPDPQDMPAKFWLKLSQDDATLGKLTHQLAAIEALPDWRKSLNPPPHYWWWFPQPSETKPALGWLWSGLTLAALPIILALAKDISTRFLTGAPGILGSIGIILPATLGLFAAGGALTKVGQQILESLFSNQGTAKRSWPRLKFLIALGLLLALFAFHTLGLPWAANRYYHLGRQQYFKGGQLASAQASFQRALSLEPDFPAAQHYMGLIYEDLRDFDQAKAAYAKAVNADFVKSFNNLARLTLLVDEDPDSAAVLLLRAIDDKNRDKTDLDLEYTLRKNLGWALLLQKRYLEAQAQLGEAIFLEDQLSRTWPDAHCLMAQVLEAQNQPADAERETCRRYIELPEDDIWTKYLNQAPMEETPDASETP